MASHRDLPREQVESVLARLPGEWGPVFLSPTDVSSLGISGAHNLGIAASGIIPSTGTSLQMYDENVIAGFTVLRQEPNPKRDKGEGDANADHYVLVELGNGYRLHGPYRKQKTMSSNAGIPHWPTEREFFGFIDGIQVELQ